MQSALQSEVPVSGWWWGEGVLVFRLSSIVSCCPSVPCVLFLEDCFDEI